MRRQAMGLAFLVLVIILPSAVARPEAPEDEKLYGTWVLSDIEVMGNKTPVPGETKTILVLSKGGKAIMKEPGRADINGTWKVGVDKNIKEIDVVGPRNKGDDQVHWKAIYEIDGDILKLAMRGDGTRPTAFSDESVGILTLKREKP